MELGRPVTATNPTYDPVFEIRDKPLLLYCRENACRRPQFGMIHKRLRLVLHTGFGATNDLDRNKI